MLVVPDATPVTIPAELTVAAEVLLLNQVPPVGVELSVMVVPVQTDEGPAIGVGALLTVTVVVMLQPVPSEYVIRDVPAATPQTIPLDEPMVATPVLLLVHTPPVTLLPNV
jgi:hypothetical protein